MSGVSKSYDYIVIGAGSAGCVLANRLSEDKDVKVLVLEAGRKDDHIYMRMPIAFTRISWNKNYLWYYESEPEPEMNNRRIPIRRGKTLGGSSSVNGMVYTRGHRLDYDIWAQKGADGWTYANCLPYFKKLETSWRGEEKFHGGSGPLKVALNDVPIMHYDSLAASTAAAGFPVTDDLYGENPEGCAKMEITVGDGERSSTAKAYLHPAMGRPNLQVETGALTKRVIVEKGRAVGVEYIQDGQTHTVHADREVILSSGSYGSPQTLMLSGIGPADHLREVGVTPIHDLKGVGQNLYEHPICRLVFKANTDNTFLQHLRWDRSVFNAARWYFFKSGPFATNAAVANIFIRTTPEIERPDIQLLCSSVGLDAQMWYPGVTAPPIHRFNTGVSLLHPQSRGWVKLRSATPGDQPRIFFNFYDVKDDLDRMVNGFKAAREIYRGGPVGKMIEKELWPGEGHLSDKDTEAWVRQESSINQHPLGTCLMGHGPEAVVDPQCRVYGIDGLRVVDASIMPDEPGGNINIPTIMMAERAADMIRGRSLLAPADV